MAAELAAGTQLLLRQTKAAAHGRQDGGHYGVSLAQTERVARRRPDTVLDHL